jgi:signal transduction histidine kinase
MNQDIKKQILKYRQIFVIIFLVLSISAYSVFNFIKQKNIEVHLKQTTQIYSKAYNTIFDQYKELSNVIFTGISHLGEVKKNFNQLQTADTDEENKIRKKLYNKIKQRYEVLKSKNILNINFILPNNTVFLKMRKPSKYGNQITKRRKTVEYVHLHKKAIDSYEVGMYGTGYRFVYPILDKGKYLGSMDITFGANAITSAIMKQYNVLSNFFIKDTNFDPLYLKKKKQFLPSHHKGYLFDRSVLKALKKVSNKDMKKLKPSKVTTTQVYINAHHNNPKSLYDQSIESIITTIPIKHLLSNKHEAFLTVRSKDLSLKVLNQNYTIMLLLTIILTAIVLFVVYQQLIKNILDKETMKQTLEKDKQLLEQAKMAQMGEMIGNIAHQWRQPLSAISTAASGIKVKQEFGMLKNEEIPTFMESIIRNTSYLSTTIDTFRDFIKETNDKKEIIIQEKIAKTLEIVDATLESNYIEIIDEIDYDHPIKTTMMQGALSQVLMNLLNNSKDVMVEKEIENRWIKLQQEIKDDIFIITIEDNGGGIPQEIITKIFDPYFTTKHKSQGTGLGLYMSKEIVQKHLLGKIYTHNTKNGAKFFVEIPFEKRINE